MQERLVDVSLPLVAHRQPAVTLQPRQRSLHHPPMPPQPLAALDPAPGDTALDAAPPEGLSALLGVVTFVRMQLLRALPRTTPRAFDRPYGVHEFLEDVGGVDVGGGENH